MALTRITKGVIKPNENYDTHNINSTGIVTATGANITGNLSVGGVLTYEDVTSIDSVGVVTARAGLVSPNADIDDFISVGSNIHLGNAGVVTATSFVGSGAALTGIDATAIKDSGGNVKIQAQASGAIHTGISTFDTIKVGTGVTIESNGQAEIAGITTFYKDVHIKSGTNRLYLGTADRLSLIADPSHSYLRNAGSGSHFQIHSNNFSIRSYDGNGSTTLFYSPVSDGNEGGGPRLYHNHGAGLRLERLRTTKSGVNITGVTTTTGLAVTGVSTFAGAIDLNADLDVDGHTNLDNLSISGVTTISRTGGNGLLKVERASGAGLHIQAQTALGVFGTTSNHNLRFISNGNERMLLSTNGNIGIGTANPQSILDISKDVSAGVNEVNIRNHHPSGGAALRLKTQGTYGSPTYQAILGASDAGGTIRVGSVSNHPLLLLTNNTERVRITDGQLTMYNGTVDLQSHMIRVGNRTTSQINAGVSTATGALTLDTTTNNIKFYANAKWLSVKNFGNDGSSANSAARSAKELLDNGFSTSGVYFLDMHGAYSAGNAKRHYCLMDSSYDGGGWTLLYCMNHGNNFASGSNYSFALNVGSNPTTENDFIASNFGYDRRNTFTPQANDQFLIRRSDNNDWKRFVVSTWSPTYNNISDGWSCTQSTDGQNRGHPYYAYGQMYDSSGNAVSGMVHFNGCALGGNCNSGGGDGDGFGDHINWSSGYAPYSCWGGAYNAQSNGGSPLYWGQGNTLSQGGSLYVQMFYRRTGTQ